MAWLAKYQFNNAERLPEVDAPITIIHGTDDRIIPIRFGRRLAEAAPDRVRMIELEGAGHNDMLTNPEFESSLSDVVGDITLR
jgi:pimeloyl-ACP methyl ester carboxylesterase